MLFTASAAEAEFSEKVVRIGVLSDFNGVYSGWAGKGSLVATQIAVEDFKAQHPDAPFQIDVIHADFQNKADIAAGIAREWIDVKGVDAIVDVPNSAAALAVTSILRNSRAAFLMTGPIVDALTRKECSPNAVQWTYDSYSVANSTAHAGLDQGGKSWFFISADFSGPISIERIAREAVTAGGGQVLGAARPPLSTPDFSSFLLQAQFSGAQVIGFALGGSDFITAIKQAAEFGLARSGRKLAPLIAYMPDIKSLGLETAQGLLFTQAFYWDVDDATRAFSKRLAERNDGRYPSDVQAGAYSATLHYLKAVLASKTDDGREVVKAMKKMPVGDHVMGPGTIRPDGRYLHTMFLTEVKSPSESKGPWDLLKIVKKVPGGEAFAPPSAECALNTVR